ncbi:hypothetical protein [Flavitalea sp.]|nr:hypothetical protein [Flavitalea sp.]
MTTETILSVLVDLNNLKKSHFKSTRVSADVEYGIFSSIHRMKSQPGGSRTYPFYLIKNNGGTYVAAIYEMMEDLHWAVLPEHRRQGCLIKPLQESIIPHLLQDREIMTISINPEIGIEEAAASEKIATKIGFKKFKEEGGETFYRILKTDITAD